MNEIHSQDSQFPVASFDRAEPVGSPREIIYKGETIRIPDAFWDDATDSPNIGALLKSHADLRRQLSARVEEGRGVEGHCGAPECYELVVPEYLQGMIEADPEDPRWELVQEWGRRNGISQEAMEELLAVQLEAEANAFAENDLASLQEEEVLNQALGPNHERIKRDIVRWTNGLLGDLLQEDPGMLAAAERLVSDTKGVLLLRAVMQRIGERSLPSSGGAGDSLNPDSLKKLQNSEAYRRGDPEARRRVRDGYRRLFPDA